MESNSREEEPQGSGQRGVELVDKYNWGFLCTPRIVCGGKRDLPPFYGKDEKIPVLLAAVMGLQHALAMVGGIITPPLLISKSAGFSTSSQEYLVSAALIVSSLASLIQIMQFKIPFTSYVLGSGLLSVMGITFSVVSIAEEVISVLTACTCNGISCSVNGSCKACNQQLEGDCLSAEDAYGHVLGTVLTSKALCTGNGDVKLPFGHRYYVGLGFVVLCALVLVEMFGSPFMRNSQVIIGLAIGMLVASSVHVTLCEDDCQLQSCRDICYDVLPQGVHYNSSTRTISGIPKSFYENSSVCVQQCNPIICNKTCHKYRYVTGTKIASADWVTFLWVHTFPLKFYAPAVLPLLFALITSTMECIGDVTATVEASCLEPFGPEFEKSIQGAVLADGLNTFWAALGTMIPVVTYAQNNGVISLSRCASRRAGIACCMWLFVLGVFSKFAAILVSIPDCVLGGMTTFLYTSVMVSGIRVLNLRIGLTRRNRFISMISLGIGLGVNLVPAWVNISGQSNYPFQGNLWPVNPRWSAGYRGFRDAIILVLSNGFSVGGLLALVLNLILPFDDDEKEIPSQQPLIVRSTSINNGN